MFEAEFWVAASTILFLLVLIYFGVHKQIFDALDSRRARIQAELDEARRLKEEAQKLVAEYKAKQKEAEGEAKALIEGARAESERYAQEMREKMDDFVARRTKMAEVKIAQAETQAMADVRAAAADAAVTAASGILAQSAKGKVGDDLLTRGIADVKAKLN
jgi:F-type H+-transporting ATPase subunit b